MADSGFFKRLGRLFSTDTVIRNVGGKLKVSDTQHIQAFSDLETNFNKGRGTAGLSYLHSTAFRSGYDPLTGYSTQRITIFTDYELMEMDPIISSALDIFADESTVKNEYGDILTIKTDNEKVSDVLHNLFYDIMNIEFNAWPWYRQMCKYGDMFLKLEISEQYGIVNVIPVSAYELTREEGLDPAQPHLVRFNMLAGAERRTYENYEIAHFRLLSDMNFLPYGKSAIESARRVWKQLQLMEDAMLIHRIMRAPEKRVFKIDVGNIAQNDVENYLKMMVNKIKKVPYVDPRTGEYNLKFNIQNMTEDFFVPVRGGDSGTEIETLNGLEFNGIDDIEYLRNKMMAALKVPKSFLGYEEGISGKATLAAEDIRFARTIERYQRTFVSELKKIALIHLFAQGFSDEDIASFSLEFTNPSTIYEQEKISLWQEKISLARDMKETKMFDNEWIYKNIFKFTDDDIRERNKNILADVKTAFRYTQIENEGNDPFKTNQTFGTRHDLAVLQESDQTGKELNFGQNNFDEDSKYVSNSDKEEDRSTSNYGQDGHARGRDPLGAKDFSNAHNALNTRKSEPFKGGSPMALRNSVEKGLTRLSNGGKTKNVIKESLSDTEEITENNDFLNEKNILDIQ